MREGGGGVKITYQSGFQLALLRGTSYSYRIFSYYLRSKLKKSFFCYLFRLFRNLVKNEEKSDFFKIAKFICFQFFNKKRVFIQIRMTFYEVSFEVYYVSVSKKLVILEFSRKIFSF